MIPDSAEGSQKSKMGDLQLPKALPELSPSPPPIFSLNSELETKDHVDFYSSPFDNSFPYKGILNNERTFSSSSSTSVSSFTDSSFTPNLKGAQQDDNTNSNDNYGLLTTSTPTRGSQSGSSAAAEFHRLLDVGDFDGDFFPQGSQLNDSAATNAGVLSNKWESPTKSPNRFDFSFPTPESSILNNGSGRCLDSPERFMNDNYSNYANQWNNGDASSLLDNEVPESYSGNAALALGNSVWNSSQVSANSVSDNDRQWDASVLNTLSKQDLLKFKATLKAKLEEYVQNGNEVLATQCQVVYMQVTEQLIDNFLPIHDSEVSIANSAASQVVSPTSQIVSPGSQIVSPNSHIASPLPLPPTPNEGGFDRDRARMHRNATEYKVAPQTWHGILPPRNHRNATYSNKVFLGGLPWDIMENTLMHTFRAFGIMRIEWPGKDQISYKQIKGYAYAIFENEKQVRNLLGNCTQDFTSSQEGKYFYKISSKKYRGKDVEVIPWGSTDCTFNQTCKIDASRTIFVGALHGMVNAEALANIMNDLFGGVIFAGIDLDRNKYPIGSARVTFSNEESYMNAVNSRFVFIKTARFTKKLQVDPYLEDHKCDVCKLQQGPYFCREPGCFHYFCRTCFQEMHSSGDMQNHEPIMRNHNNRQSYSPNASIYTPSYTKWGKPTNFDWEESPMNENYPLANGNHPSLNGSHHVMNGHHNMNWNHVQHGNGSYSGPRYGRNDPLPMEESCKNIQWLPLRWPTTTRSAATKPAPPTAV
ncbi:Cytoplasmic polyadenylation element-binding protein 1-B [Orchesella cincta]|uniref:Cytoplasmic polyadenylation element-binding protein 1-B n=1 Tax=Orchesella cincta TaxID=48709 RepID=A0A1D2NBL0_ORCCI|nr:Cytoplasmic polyadenylation element-binding protein 1-B [Orchesella cincta]